METAVSGMRARGEKFSLSLTSLASRPIEAEGQVVGGRAILRLKDVRGIKRELAELLGALPASARRRRRHARPVRGATVAGLGARRSRQADLRQCRLARAVEARGLRRSGRSGASSCSTAMRTPIRIARTSRAAIQPAGCRAIVAGERRDVRRGRPSRPGAARPASPSTPPRPRPCGPSSAQDRRAPRAPSTSSPPPSPSSAPTAARSGTTPPIARSGTSTRPSSTRGRRLGRARPAARRAAAAGAAGLPQVEGRAARGLSRDRGRQPRMAPAGRPHAARRHHAQSRRRRDLLLRRRHRARSNCAGATKRRCGCRAKPSTTSAKKSRCSLATGGCGCSTRRSRRCGSRSGGARRTGRMSRRTWPGAGDWATSRSGRRCGPPSPPSTAVTQRAGRLRRRDGRVVSAPGCRCPTAASRHLPGRRRVRRTSNGPPRAHRGARGRRRAQERVPPHVSCELRSPLTNIIGLCEFLGDLASAR